MRAILCLLTVLSLGLAPLPRDTDACCPAAPSDMPVVNADQTVLIIWDAEGKTQHFIRQASFKSESAEFGFLVPSPNEPELAETGQTAFVHLAKLTEPERVKQPRPAPNISCGCGSNVQTFSQVGSVTVLQEKLVAGYKAVVLKAGSTSALADWLKDNGFAYSPEVKEWAEPYVKNGWAFTALRLAKRKDGENAPGVDASALRISFKTDRPLFPYREPKSQESAEALNAHSRLLRIFFVAEARMKGVFPDGQSWNAKTAWSNRLPDEERLRVLETLGLPGSAGPTHWHLTEFEHRWPYAAAPGDVYFVRDPDQVPVKRPPWIEYTGSKNSSDVFFLGVAALAAVSLAAGRLRLGSPPRRGQGPCGHLPFR